MTATVPATRRDQLRRLVILVVVLACVGGLALAVQHTRRGDEEIAITGGNVTVELLTPTQNQTQVNQQAQVGIDLTFGYDVESLVINGTVIPEDQLQRFPDLAAAYFQPGPGKVLEQLPAERVCATASIRTVANTGKQVQPVSWCFNVA